MATLNKASFEAKYNDPSTGQFKTGQSRGIGSDDMRNVIEDETDSIPFTEDDSYTWSSPQVTAAGTNTYTAIAAPAIAAYATGQKFQIKFTNASSGVSTLNLNALGAKKIFANPTTQATTGHILAGQISLLAYDAALDAAAGGFLMLGAPATTSGTVTSVNGTTNRIAVDNTNPAAPIVNIDPAYDTAVTNAINAKVADAINDGTTTIAPSQNAVFDALALKLNITAFAPYVIDQVSTSVAGGTITLDMNSQIQRSHIGSATFAAAKILAMSNTTNSMFFNFIFEITSVSAVLTFPSDWVSSSLDFNGTAWTPPNTGKFEFGGSFDDINNIWYIKISGPFT
jgi:hypothetical protein